MTVLVLDTNAYGSFFRGEPRTLQLLRTAQEIHLPVIVLGELLAGFAGGTLEQKKRDGLARFMASPRVHVMTVDEKTPRFYADTLGELRAKGRPIPTNDVWIAALARQHRMPLVSFDAHFATVAGLAVINPAAEPS